MTTQERVIRLCEQGIDMQLITLVLRSEGIPDAEIAQAYDHMASLGPTEIVGGHHYMRIVEK